MSLWMLGIMVVVQFMAAAKKTLGKGLKVGLPKAVAIRQKTVHI